MIKIGLLKFTEVDLFTGYRYYDMSQILQLNRNLALKDLGLTLEQIGDLLKNNLPNEQLFGMLRLKRTEIWQMIHEEQNHLMMIEILLRQIGMEGQMPDYGVVIKTAVPQTIASIRSTIPAYPA